VETGCRIRSAEQPKFRERAFLEAGTATSIQSRNGGHWGDCGERKVHFEGEFLGWGINQISPNLCRPAGGSWVVPASQVFIMNADVNGGYNIWRKAVPEAFAVDGIECVGLHPDSVTV
jgi:hypothetical protein